MSLLKPGLDAEPLELPRTAPAAGLYAVLTALLFLAAVLLMSSTAYRENTGLTLLEARERSRAVLPLVLGLLASSLLLALQARLCWVTSRLAPWLGGLGLSANLAVVILAPAGLRQYGVLFAVAQALALMVYLWLRSRSATSGARA